MRENARLTEKWLRWEKENFIPEMMREMKFDMWIVSEDDRALYPFLVPANEEGLVTREPYFLVYCNSENGKHFEEIHVGNMNNFNEWGPLYPNQVFTLEESLEWIQDQLLSLGFAPSQVYLRLFILKEPDPRIISFNGETC